MTWSVLPVGCFSTISSRPSPSLITASPIGGGYHARVVATSPSRSGEPLRNATVIFARSSGDSMAAACRTAIRWLGMSTNPPPETTDESVTALTTASSVTPFSRSRSGSTSTWYCRSRWPQIATFATPGIDISRGRIVHFASRVMSICESVLDDTPIFSRRLVEDSGDRITGLFAAAGSRADSTASRSCTTCRADIRSVPSLRISTTDDSPSTDFDRIVLSPIVPLSAFSSGTLIRLSTSSVNSPGASVWISIRGGANSGNTSRGALRALCTPTIISTIDSASTSTRIRNDDETIQFIMG